MTRQRTLTTAHWGIYEVEYDDKGQAVKLHPFSKDPDPSPIGLHMLSDEVSRLRVLRPFGAQELAGARPRQRTATSAARSRSSNSRGTRRSTASPRRSSA